MAFKMKGFPMIQGASPAKNYKNPQDYKVFNMGNKPDGPLKKEIPENIKASTRTDYKKSKSKGTQNVITNASNREKLNDIEDKISFIKEDVFQGRTTNREANKRIKELKKSEKLFREKHLQDIKKSKNNKPDQSKFSDLEKYDDDKN